MFFFFVLVPKFVPILLALFAFGPMFVEFRLDLFDSIAYAAKFVLRHVYNSRHLSKYKFPTSFTFPFIIRRYNPPPVLRIVLAIYLPSTAFARYISQDDGKVLVAQWIHVVHIEADKHVVIGLKNRKYICIY